MFQSIKEEDNEYASVKQDLRVQIRDMRRTVSNLSHTCHIPVPVVYLSYTCTCCIPFMYRYLSYTCTCIYVDNC